MTDTGPSVGKRSACDRCRTQKLGCMRVNGHPTDACLRCVRSQVECVTSSSRRPGRPAKAAAAAAAAASLSSGGASPQRNDDYAPLLGPLDVDDTFDFATLDVPYEIPSSFWASKDIATLYPDDYFPDSGMIIDDDRSPSMPALDLPPSADNAGQLRKSRMQLAHIHQTLTRQLLRLQSSPCDLTDMLRVTCVHHHHHHHMKSSESPATSTSTSSSSSSSSSPSNPLATLTTTAAEFTDILSALVPPHNNPHRPPSSPSHPILNPLTTPDLLIILSCYILLLHIHDYILTQLLTQLTTNPAALDAALQCAPVLSLGGLPVPPARNLPAHLLLVLFNAQILPIEAVLGLPDSLRVSVSDGNVKDGRGSGSGRFGQGQAGLFSGAGGQALCMALVQVEIERAASGTGGLGVIAALREKRVRVLEV